MTSTSSSPFLSQSDKMSPSKLCNLIVSLPLHHCPQTHSPFQPLFSPSPLPDCLSIKSLQHSISTFHTFKNQLLSPAQKHL